MPPGSSTRNRHNRSMLGQGNKARLRPPRGTVGSDRLSQPVRSGPFPIHASQLAGLGL